jgi:hypothetical protein
MTGARQICLAVRLPATTQKVDLDLDNLRAWLRIYQICQTVNLPIHPSVNLPQHTHPTHTHTHTHTNLYYREDGGVGCGGNDDCTTEGTIAFSLSCPKSPYSPFSYLLPLPLSCSLYYAHVLHPQLPRNSRPGHYSLPIHCPLIIHICHTVKLSNCQSHSMYSLAVLTHRTDTVLAH